jgi:Glycosyltransferase Family 4
MPPISVLFTNNTLGQRAGSEIYVRDVALALQRRGHRPMAFSLVLGTVADELRAATIPVVDDVTRIGEPPDVIHGHHHVETLIAALAFPDTPVVNFCHGWVPWEEMPLVHPAVRRYVAVDEVCVDRLVREEGIAPDRIELLLNFVDLDRFRPRLPLPEVPIRALVLSNSAAPDGYARVITAACQSAGITVDVVGVAAGKTSTTPETLLTGYDLVFAKGRTVLESLAVGCATVLADWAGAGPLVTPDNYSRLRRRNFGIRELQHAHDVGWYRNQIARYRSGAAAEVSRRVRADAGMEPAIDRLLTIYNTAIAEPSRTDDASQAAARHLSRIARPLKEAYGLSAQVQTITADLAVARASSRTLESSVRALEQQLRAHEQELTEARDAARVAREQLAQVRSSATLRIRDVLLKLPIVGPATHAGARRLAQMLRSS